MTNNMDRSGSPSRGSQLRRLLQGAFLTNTMGAKTTSYDSKTTSCGHAASSSQPWAKASNKGNQDQASLHQEEEEQQQRRSLSFQESSELNVARLGQDAA